jgi:large subunit ribosomal protein L17
MRHQVKTKRLNRDEAHRNAMTRNMVTSVILYERIKTTAPKAKYIQPIVDKLFSAVKGDNKLTVKRRLNSFLTDKNAIKKMLEELTTRYKDRKSGFTRITQLGFRAGDAAPMVTLELV